MYYSISCENHPKIQLVLIPIKFFCLFFNQHSLVRILTAKERDRARAVFQSLDQDKDGIITVGEAKRAQTSWFYKINKESQSCNVRWVGHLTVIYCRVIMAPYTIYKELQTNIQNRFRKPCNLSGSMGSREFLKACQRQPILTALAILACFPHLCSWIKA